MCSATRTCSEAFCTCGHERFACDSPCGLQGPDLPQGKRNSLAHFFNAILPVKVARKEVITHVEFCKLAQLQYMCNCIPAVRDCTSSTVS